jgi:hypothetical protein
MTRHSFLLLCAAAAALVTTTAAAAEKKPEPLAIRMSASFAPAETDVVVRMRVEPDARARELTVEWVSDDLSGGSHAITLEGARAATTHQYAIRRMSPGAYVVTATLRLDDGTEIRRGSSVTVIGMGSPDLAGSGAAQGSAGGSRPLGRR